MELVKKVCRFCYKDFTTPRKQQRYCGTTCAYRGKNRNAFNSYLGPNRHNETISTESMKLQRWRPETDMAGLSMDRERYSE